MKEYKVKIVSIPLSSLSMKKHWKKTEEELEKVLSQLAVEGWELVSTQHSPNSSTFFLFMERDIRNLV